MKTFVDTAGRPWLVTVNVAGVKQVRNKLGVDLYGLIDSGAKPLADLLGDPCRFVDVLFVLCEEQAGKANVSDEVFGCGLAGDALELAGEAFVEALIDFFPNARVRDNLRKLKAAARKLTDLSLAKVEKKLDAMDLETLVEKLASESGSLPVSSASTRDRLPSASSSPWPMVDGASSGSTPAT